MPPTIKVYRHTCDYCDYSTKADTTSRAEGMPRHKSRDARVGNVWCFGSGKMPGSSELLSETPDPTFRQRMDAKRRAARYEEESAKRIREDFARAAAADAARVYRNVAGDIVYRQPDGTFRSDRDTRGVPL